MMKVYMHIKGFVGEVTEAPYLGWMEVEPTLVQLTNGPFFPGNGSQRIKEERRSIQIKKIFDNSAARMKLYADTGKPIGTVTLVYGELQPNFVPSGKFTLSDVILDRVQIEERSGVIYQLMTLSVQSFSTTLLSSLSLTHESSHALSLLRSMPTRPSK